MISDSFVVVTKMLTLLDIPLQGRLRHQAINLALLLFEKGRDTTRGKSPPRTM